MDEIEVIKIDGDVAHISYRLKEYSSDDLNNGYRHMTVPYNPREIQLSVRDNVLVDQSVKSYDVCSGS